MKALRTLSPLFWKYKGRLFAGIVFILFTNVLAVFAPALVGEGVNVMRDRLSIRITEKESYYEEYEAYGEINTYALYHNENTLAEMINDSGYAPPRFNHYSENMINLHMEYNEI